MNFEEWSKTRTITPQLELFTDNSAGPGFYYTTVDGSISYIIIFGSQFIVQIGNQETVFDNIYNAEEYLFNEFVKEELL